MSAAIARFRVPDPEPIMPPERSELVRRMDEMIRRLEAAEARFEHRLDVQDRQRTAMWERIDELTRLRGAYGETARDVAAIKDALGGAGGLELVKWARRLAVAAVSLFATGVAGALIGWLTGKLHWGGQ